jgi:hypothetical protein
MMLKKFTNYSIKINGDQSKSKYLEENQDQFSDQSLWTMFQMMLIYFLP